MLYPGDEFSEAERARLRPYFTNLDRPVFPLVNLPETVKGAMFARYSRYPGTLRRLFLEEFADSLPEEVPPWHRHEGKRAADLYERVFVGYGDDSIAQIGGVHLACEWTSNILTKILQRPRLGAYLEQSTRYIAYDRPTPAGGTATTGDPSSDPSLRSRRWIELFDAYAPASPRVPIMGRAATLPARRRPAPQPPTRARCKAKALDLLRGLLPAALAVARGHLRVSGQTYEQLDPAPARPSRCPRRAACGEHDPSNAAQAVDARASSHARRRVPTAAAAWIDFLQRERARRQTVRCADSGSSCRRATATERAVGAPACSVEGDERTAARRRSCSRPPTRRSDGRIGERDRGRCHAATQGAQLHRRPGRRGATNRRHRPGRGLRGAALPLRDRLRLRRLPRPAAPPDAHRPVADARRPSSAPTYPRRYDAGGCRHDYRRALEISRREYERLRRCRPPGGTGAVRAVPRLPDPLHA